MVCERESEPLRRSLGLLALMRWISGRTRRTCREIARAVNTFVAHAAASERHDRFLSGKSAHEHSVTGHQSLAAALTAGVRVEVMPTRSPRVPTLTPESAR